MATIPVRGLRVRARAMTSSPDMSGKEIATAIAVQPSWRASRPSLPVPTTTVLLVSGERRRSTTRARSGSSSTTTTRTGSRPSSRSLWYIEFVIGVGGSGHEGAGRLQDGAGLSLAAPVVDPDLPCDLGSQDHRTPADRRRESAAVRLDGLQTHGLSGADALFIEELEQLLVLFEH